MRHSHALGTEDDRVVLRALVGRIEHDLADLPSPEQRVLEQLRRDWAQLVERLALGPAPELRECPVCGRAGMRAATRCGFCWTKLAPPPQGPA